MKAQIYVLFSDREQAEGASTSRELRYGKIVAEDLRWESVGELHDRGKSAFTGKNCEIGAALGGFARVLSEALGALVPVVEAVEKPTDYTGEYTNKIERAVNGIFGIIDAGESDPEAYPRTSVARDAADVATKTLRYIADKADSKETRRQLSESFVNLTLGL